MLLRHGALYLLAKGLPGLVNFAAIAVFTRLLSPEGYGRYVLVLAAVGFADAVLFQWLRLGVLRFLPAEKRPGALLATAAAALLALAGATALLALPAALLAPTRELRTLLLLGCGLLWAHALFELQLELLRARLSPTRYGLYSLVKALGSLLGGALLVRAGLGPEGLLAGMGVGMLLPLAAFRGLREWRGARWRGADAAVLRRLVGYGAPLALTFALGFVVSASDRFLLAWLLGSGEAGLYAVGHDFGQYTLVMLMTIVNLAAYPLAVRALEEDGVEAARAQLRRNGLLLLGVALPAGVALALLAENVALVFLGEEFRAAAAVVIPWVALAALLAGLKAFYVDRGFQLGRGTAGQAWAMLAAAGVNVGLNLWWIPAFGLVGAVYATVGAYLVALALGWVLARRVFPLPGLPSDSLRVVLAAAAMAAALWPLRGWTGGAALAVQVLAGAVTYAAAAAALDVGGVQRAAAAVLKRARVGA